MIMGHYQFSVSGMSCEHCRCRIQRALEALPGVTSVEVDLETGSADVEAAPESITPDDLVAKVEEVGYEAGEVTGP
jgi:P-type Cu2+ transporter